MANDEDVARLRQGAAIWNDWRKQNARQCGVLQMLNLGGANLGGANLRSADLSWADLRGAFLEEADLSKANLRSAFLEEADLRSADLSKANLAGADLSWATLSEANLREADLAEADLHKTNLREADLAAASLRGPDLHEANLREAELYETVFSNVDMSEAKGLDACNHSGPSVLDHRTLQRSGRLPLAFLRGCGLPDRLIDYLPSLLDEAIQYYSCFISYSSKDEAFANRLYADLQNNGVRCWFAPHDLQIGAKTWDAIDAAIRVRDKVLLILSKGAIASDWVENEVSKGTCRRAAP